METGETAEERYLRMRENETEEERRARISRIVAEAGNIQIDKPNQNGQTNDLLMGAAFLLGMHHLHR
jgi:hypothetical protein